MIPVSPAELARLTGGELHDVADPDAPVVGGATVDSRHVTPGGLFVALPGQHVDGHEYAAAAVTAGAALVLGARPTGVPTLVVTDPLAALGRVARDQVDRLHAAGATVVALTGSQGKTGTKDYLAQLLDAIGPTVATAGNLNNEIGVPLTVLRAGAETRFLVLEMGARGPGHIAHLCRLAPPDVAMVLNVGTAHLGEFGSREAIARAKGEIVAALGPDGIAVLGADDPVVAAMAGRTTARVRTFGRRTADTVALDPVQDDLGRPGFELRHDGEMAPVQLRQVGAHQVDNALGAAAVALALGVSLPVVADRLGTAVSASPWRMELTERPDGTVVLNDAYNANPQSVASALETLAHLGRRRGARTVAVLGEMKELGDEAVTAHREVGRYAAELGVDVLVLVGDAGRQIAEGAEAAGGTAVVFRTSGREDVTTRVRENVAAGDVVLVKASRGVALERVAEELLAPVEEGRHVR